MVEHRWGYGELSHRGSGFEDDGFGDHPSGQARHGYPYGSPGNEPPGQGLVAYYPMDAHLRDVVGENDGTASNVTVGGGFGGRRGYNFNGVDAEVTLPTLGFSGDSAITIAAWIRVDSDAGSDNNIFGFGTSGTNGATCSLRTDTSTALYFYFWGDDLTVSVPDMYGTWVHVAATYDPASTTRKIYLNGSVSGSDSPASPSFDDANYSIGGFNGEWFKGEMLDVRVYDRALSDSEIGRLGDWTPPGARDGMVGYWPLVSDGRDIAGPGDGVTTDVTQGPGPLGLDALYFDGVGSEVSVQADCEPRGGFSLAFWAKPQISFESSSTSAKSGLARSGMFRSGSVNTFATFPRMIGGDVEVYLSESGYVNAFFQRNPSGRLYFDTGDTTSGNIVEFDDDEWQHFVFWYDGAKMGVIKNGEPLVRNKTTEEPLTIDTLRFGSSGGSNYFQGGLADVRLYNRALAVGDAERLYKMQVPGSKPRDDYLIDRMRYGLTGRWPLGDSGDEVAEITSRRKPGVQSGTTTETPGPQRYPVRQFDGIDDYITLPGYSNENWSVVDRSVSFWMRTDGTGGTVFSKHQGTHPVEIRLRHDATNDALILTASDANGNSVTITTSIPDQEWMHIAIVSARDTEGQLELYIDGELKGTADTSALADI